MCNGIKLNIGKVQFEKIKKYIIAYTTLHY